MSGSYHILMYLFSTGQGNFMIQGVLTIAFALFLFMCSRRAPHLTPYNLAIVLPLIFYINTNLYYWNKLGDLNDDQKMSNELNLTITYVIQNTCNLISFKFCVLVQAPCYLIAVLLQYRAICTVDADANLLMMDGKTCAQYSHMRILQSVLFVAICCLNQYIQQYIMNHLLIRHEFTLKQQS